MSQLELYNEMNLQQVLSVTRKSSQAHQQLMTQLESWDASAFRPSGPHEKRR